MQFLDILSFSFSILGIHGLVLSLRHLIPYYITPSLSELLNETQRLLGRAETIGAIPLESEHRTHLDSSANEFTMMRIESGHAQGLFRQLRVAIQRGLTCRLLVLCYRIESIKSKLELAVDEQQLTISESAESATGTVEVVPSPTVGTATLMNTAIEPTLPLPVTTV